MESGICDLLKLYISINSDKSCATLKKDSLH